MPTKLILDEDNVSKLRILVADPVLQMRKIIHNILIHNIGVDEVVDVSNGEKALETLQKIPCDLLILDAAMRPLGGVELARRIRKNEEEIDPFIPIIIISDHPERGDVLGARDAGVTDFLAKPLSAKILDLRVRDLMKNPRPYVKSENFFGPDRRRHVPDAPDADERRVNEPKIIEHN